MAVEVTDRAGGDNKSFPTKNQLIEVHYKLSLGINPKTVIDSTYDRKLPFRYTVGTGQVIKGFDEGIQQLSVGDTAFIKISADCAYGDDGAGKLIPPKSDLIFEVNLLKIFTT